jgi:hypothetical protein
MKRSITLEELDSIERNIRRRLEELDQNYERERALLQKELEKFIEAKRSMTDFFDKYGGEKVGPSALQTEETPAGSGDETAFREMPWGRYASGVDKVLYVIKEAGTRGLGRLEVVDRIEEILGEKPELNSVTTWLYRAKKRGQIRNRRRRWYVNF